MTKIWTLHGTSTCAHLTYHCSCCCSLFTACITSYSVHVICTGTSHVCTCTCTVVHNSGKIANHMNNLHILILGNTWADLCTWSCMNSCDLESTSMKCQMKSKHTRYFVWQVSYYIQCITVTGAMPCSIRSSLLGHMITAFKKSQDKYVGEWSCLSVTSLGTLPV